MTFLNIDPQGAGAELSEQLTSAELQVSQVIRREVLECSPDTPVQEAARLMSEARCSSVVVASQGRTLGIWTERDALSIDFGNPDAFMVPIGDVMSAPVRTVSPEAKLHEVAVRFRKERVRHFLVVGEEGERIGIISQTDVVLNQGIEYYMRLKTIDSVMQRRLLVSQESASLDEVARLMRNASADAVAIEYEDGGYGILTERDIVRFIAERCAGESVGRLASRPLITVEVTASLYRARTVLIQSRVRHIGVTDADDNLMGIVSFSDILTGMELAYVQELQRALRDRNDALRTSQRSLHLAEKVIESSLEGIVITDRNGFIESVNPAFTRLTGYTPQEVLGKNPSLLSSGRHDNAFYEQMWKRLKSDGHWQGEIWNRRKSGEVYPELLTITAIRDEAGQLTHYAALFSDISELKENEERIKHLAYYDPLTGLPNRRLFGDRLKIGVAHAHRHNRRLAVLFVDLDRFKRVNDSLGHAVGDYLLQEVAGRLVSCVREDDTVARMGGDEFVIMLSDLEDIEEAVHVARRIIEQLTQPVVVDGEDLVVTSSIGISYYPDDSRDPQKLVRNADTAMYRAKDKGRNAYQLYTPAMNARSLEHLAMEVALRKAIQRQEMQLYFQPIYSTAGELVEAEALLRWKHPEMGVVPPDDFIPLAEETGLITSIGEWALKSACRQLARWRQQGHPDIKVAVNISVCQFKQPDFVPMVRRAVKECGIPADRLNLEMTESLMMEDGLEVIQMLSEIRDMGVGISVDDFGTGYSSLNYLKRFPIQTLKIDRCFVRDITAGSEDEAIVSAVITLAHSLKLRVIAEGVERDEQLEILRQNGCDLIQGGYFGAAESPDKFERHFHTANKLERVSGGTASNSTEG